MKIFWYELRTIQAENKPDVVRKQSYLTDQGELPETTIDVFFKYFKKNSDIRRCVIELQEAVWVEWYWYKVWEEIEYELKNVDDKLENFQDLKRRVIRDVSVSWNAYLLKLRNITNKIVWYTTIDPRTMKIVADNTWEVLSYIQYNNWKIIQKYEPTDITHCTDEKDPDNDIFWLSILEWIIYEILADDEAWLSNYHYFKNATIPSMLIRVNTEVSDDEMDNIVEQMKQQFRGGKNKHKVWLFRWVEGIEKLQDSMADMQYTKLRDFTTERICAAYGVPKVVLNYTDWVNYTNAEMQYKKYTTNTVVPRERKIERRFNDALNELFEQEWYKGTAIKILKSTESISADKIAIYEKMIQNGILTVNEARDELWYDTYVGVEEADTPLISKNYDLLNNVGLADFNTIWS